MPRAFTEPEKKKLRADLHRAGLARFARAGIRATRVDDICRDVGIAKGSFYAFYASKEDLFMAVADERDIGHKADMRVFLLETDLAGAHLLGAFFDFLMERIDSDPVLRIVRDSGELSHLSRKISPESAAENARRDIAFIHDVASILKERHQLSHADPETIMGLMTLMISLSMQSDLISQGADYPSMVRLLRDLFIARLLKGPTND
jgi:AcrR family transcriptional regulator